MLRAIACLSLLLAPTVEGSDAAKKEDLSPDGQWRYVCVDHLWPEIQETKTGRQVLDLQGDARSVPHAADAEIVWAPDSKRFAYNYSPPHAPHSTYVTTVFYELRDSHWVQLTSPVDEESSKESFAELARHFLKGTPMPALWRADPNRVVFKVEHWTDNNTALLYVHSAGRSSGESDAASEFFFNLKFDGDKCSVTSARKILRKK